MKLVYIDDALRVFQDQRGGVAVQVRADKLAALRGD